MQDTIDSHDTNARITTDWGEKIGNTDHWLAISNEDRYGSTLLEDGHGREKIHRFDHERIPERVVHARGAGAFGTFKLFESASDVTNAGGLTVSSFRGIFPLFRRRLSSPRRCSTARQRNEYGNLKFFICYRWFSQSKGHLLTYADSDPCLGYLEDNSRILEILDGVGKPGQC